MDALIDDFGGGVNHALHRVDDVPSASELPLNGAWLIGKRAVCPESLPAIHHAHEGDITGVHPLQCFQEVLGNQSGTDAVGLHEAVPILVIGLRRRRELRVLLRQFLYLQVHVDCVVFPVVGKYAVFPRQYIRAVTANQELREILKFLGVVDMNPAQNRFQSRPDKLPLNVAQVLRQIKMGDTVGVGRVIELVGNCAPHFLRQFLDGVERIHIFLYKPVYRVLELFRHFPVVGHLFVHVPDRVFRGTAQRVNGVDLIRHSQKKCLVFSGESGHDIAVCLRVVSRRRDAVLAEAPEKLGHTFFEQFTVLVLCGKLRVKIAFQLLRHFNALPRDFLAFFGKPVGVVLVTVCIHEEAC